MTEHDSNPDNADFRCGTIAIVGRPNVGKSTLLNHILGQKLSITSRKAQTTRHRLLGIHTTENTQYLFVDTPGFQQKHVNALNRSLNKTVTQVLTEVDKGNLLPLIQDFDTEFPFAAIVPVSA